MWSQASDSAGFLVISLFTSFLQILSYFESRKISRKTLARNQVKEMHHKVHGVVVVFPYFMCGETVNFKFRTLRKMFWQLKHSLKVFYGLDDIISASEIIIVEGEIDKLAMEEAGFLNCVSVPDGAPGKISAEYSPCEIEDRMFSYIWNCKEYFKKASRIIIATDGDHPGQILAEELGHRLGRERCYRVQWPKQPDGTKVYKDANEVLVELGAEALRSVVQTAKLYPVHGLLTFNYFLNELDLCIRQHIGVSTGWACLDDFYKVVPGELTLVTGAPDSGKGEWIDALAVNLVESEGWAFAMCFVGNKVQEHARKLLEKHRKKPFFNALLVPFVLRVFCACILA
ncbi:hypothetical protein KP509_1Z319500 [Ceratopteris richardii]|nr:hypothetical protein KP509_1Z319500 [Ceratopteris richardii]